MHLDTEPDGPGPVAVDEPFCDRIVTGERRAGVTAPPEDGMNSGHVARPDPSREPTQGSVPIEAVLALLPG